MSAESSTSNYYTFVSPNGDAAAWTTTHHSYKAPQNTKSRAESRGAKNAAAAGKTVPSSAGAPTKAAKPAGRSAAQSESPSPGEPIYVKAHIIDEHETPFGRKTTWANTGNNPSAGFRTSWTSAKTESQGASSRTAGKASGTTRASSTSGTSGSKTGGSFVTGVVQTVAGVGLMAVGVPMLILPGPGMAAIAGGAVLAASGVKKIIGKK